MPDGLEVGASQIQSVWFEWAADGGFDGREQWFWREGEWRPLNWLPDVLRQQGTVLVISRQTFLALAERSGADFRAVPCDPS